MHRWAIIILLVLTSSVEARELPSEVDLKAAYCIPIAQHGVSVFRSLASDEQYPDQKALLEEGTSEMTENLRRLQLYLLPRLRYLDPLGIEMARKRGEADLVKYAADSKACGTKCEPLMHKRPSALWTSCLEKCKADDALLTRMQACSDLRWLPF